MSESSGTVVVKLNDDLKGYIKEIGRLFTWDSLTEFFNAFDFKPKEYDKPDFIENIQLDITEKKVKGNYAIFQIRGEGWDQVLNMLTKIPSFQFWANLYDSNEVEKYYGKSKKDILIDVIAWDGENDPLGHSKIAELEWFGLMNKTIMKYFVSEEEVDAKLAEVKEYKSNKVEVDYWEEFYKTNFNDSLFLKLTIKNLEDRKFLTSALNLYSKAESNLPLAELINRLNTRFSGEYVVTNDNENITVFEEIYTRISYVRESENNIFIGAVLDDSNLFIEDPDSHARGYSNGKSFIDFSRFFMQLSDDFTGQVWCRKYQRAYRLTTFDGFIYMN